VDTVQGIAAVRRRRNERSFRTFHSCVETGKTRGFRVRDGNSTKRRWPNRQDSWLIYSGS